MEPIRPLARRIALVAATALSAVALAACGKSDVAAPTGHNSPSKPASSGAPIPSGKHNAADVAFAKGMIPHHRQAVEMADLAASRASSSQVKALAVKIKKAQDPEIRTLSGWLAAWGGQVPEEMPGMDHSSHTAMPGMDHSSHTAMPGMRDTKEMDSLKRKSGRAFDTSFLEMMVGHHQGAVKMAAVEKDKGAYGPAKVLADSVIKSQSAEIAQMNKLLGKG
ncbi:DUF305 domain-containing protein [Streptomyces sp. NPDC054765]